MLLLPAPCLRTSGELPLKANDRVTISIGGIPDSEVAQISKVYTISDNGTVNLLYIGEVRAAGLKPSTLQRTIEQTYIAREIYTRPTVTVSIDDAPPPRAWSMSSVAVRKTAPCHTAIPA
jgi:protein involved in polysaccharide export with SLBB domain